ncbi:hypothetical protein [Chryseobacterium indoltheticum]|uniref:hypothetical protein n=1 Tax=Chryseobacterium indoltheticum TaxID=254 RepID=UPI004041B38F
MERIFNEEILTKLNPFLKNAKVKTKLSVQKINIETLRIKKYQSKSVEKEFFYKPISKIL